MPWRSSTSRARSVPTTSRRTTSSWRPSSRRRRWSSTRATTRGSTRPSRLREEHDGSESAAAIEIAPWPAEDESRAIAAIEPAEPGAVQDPPIGDAAEMVADPVVAEVEVANVEVAEIVAVAPATEEAASFDPPAAELVELEVAASPTNGHTNGAHVVADTTPVAVAPAEPDADIALVPPDDLTADGWASDWGVDVLAPDDLTAAAFGLTNGHLAVVDEPQVEAQPDDPVEASDAEPVAAEAELVPAAAIIAEPIELAEAGRRSPSKTPSRSRLSRSSPKRLPTTPLRSSRPPSSRPAPSRSPSRSAHSRNPSRSTSSPPSGRWSPSPQPVKPSPRSSRTHRRSSAPPRRPGRPRRRARSARSRRQAPSSGRPRRRARTAPSCSCRRRRRTSAARVAASG